jgi:hypothetical protein
MLGGWQGTFCAGISTHNIERGVRGGRLCCKRTLFSYFVQSVLSLIVVTNLKETIIQHHTCRDYFLSTNGSVVPTITETRYTRTLAQHKITERPRDP